MDKTRILIVEDEVIIAELIATFLKDLEYSVCGRVTSGEEAIPTTMELKPDLILMDIWLQGKMDGIEAAERITAHSNIPIIFLTSYTDDGVVERAKTILPSGYLIKPVQKRVLRANVEMALHMAKMDEERRQSEQKLRESEAWLQSTFQQAAVGIIHTDLEGNFLKVNHQYCWMMGYSEEELLGKNFKDLTHPDYQGIQEAERTQLLEGKTTSYSFEKINIKKDGSHVWVSLTVSSVRAENGQPNYMVGIVKDISARIDVENERENLAELLQQAQKMEVIGTLAGGVAHDFNNILHPILGYSKLGIRATEHMSKVQQYFNSTHQAAERAKDLVKQILTFSRQSERKFEPVKLQPIINEVMKMLRSSIPVTIKIETDINEECGLVRADVTQIHQVIMNLATNAYHAMQESGGILKLSLQPAIIKPENTLTPMTPGNYICLTVSDSGTGIPADLLEKIFDPYFTTKDQEKGTGLGLSVVLGIVNRHAGNIQVSSEPGRGSEFAVYLPVTTENTSDTVSEKEQPGFRGQERLLVVDDEAEIVFFQTEALNQLGYATTGRSDGLEALKTFKEDPQAFDLVVTDMTMPRLTGFDLAVQLLEIRPDLPIILITGYSENVDEGKAKAVGIKRFLFKPLDQDDLAAAIRSALDEE